MCVCLVCVCLVCMCVCVCVCVDVWRDVSILVSIPMHTYVTPTEHFKENAFYGKTLNPKP